MPKTATIELPPKLLPVFDGQASYRGAYGGRGSAKTRTFALMAALKGYQEGINGREGTILVCREHLNSLKDSSLAEIKIAINSVPWLAAYYRCGEDYVRSVDGKIRFAFAGLRHNVDSIKSMARVFLCWVDEGEPVTEASWQKLLPTVREENAEVWVTWNPESKRSATHTRFRVKPPPGAKIVEMNWRDNPWFPAVLEDLRQRDKRDFPDDYNHIWEGDFRATFAGSYYASNLLEAKRQGRIANIGADPLMRIQTFWDIGSSSDRADATAIWVAQLIGKEIRLLDYYEAQGQPLKTHVEWLQDRGYERALCVLPHDGVKHDAVHKVTYQGALNELGFSTHIMVNQGKGAALKRIEAGRRMFSQCWFNDKPTEPGRDALAWYHEKRDDTRDLGLGPEHDWSSHAADAFGLLCQYAEKQTLRPSGAGKKLRPVAGLV